MAARADLHGMGGLGQARLVRDTAPVQPGTRYAESGDVSIAYQIVGDGPIDIVFVNGFIGNLEDTVSDDLGLFALALGVLAPVVRLLINLPGRLAAAPPIAVAVRTSVRFPSRNGTL